MCEMMKKQRTTRKIDKGMALFYIVSQRFSHWMDEHICKFIYISWKQISLFLIYGKIIVSFCY